MDEHLEFLQEPDGRYVAVTSESTMGGTVFVGRGSTIVGGGPESVGERAFHLNQLKRCKKVALADVPPEWLAAFGYEAPPGSAVAPATHRDRRDLVAVQRR